MENIKKKEYKFKIICNILYLIISLPGLSILFSFPPRYLLFNKKSKNFQNIFDLYKTFVKSIYENINKPFINNVTISTNNSCPDNFEVLFIKNEHFGNFSKFFGKDTVFCVEKFNKNNYNYEYLLGLVNSSEAINECKEGTRKCGILNKLYNFPLCIENDIQCPINFMEFGTYPNANIFQFYPKCFFSTLNILNEPVIVDIEIINNVKLCLEKFPIEEHYCEIYDNNLCLIVNGHKRIDCQNYPDIKLSPGNLCKWNLINDDNINHDFCNDNIFFNVFETGYINFTYQNLLDFKTEFPYENEMNNSLYETCNAFKSLVEYDILFYLLSFILLCWSVTHFVIQILFFFCKLNMRNYYIWNGIILFIFKLLSYFGMIIYHFFYYLKIKKVYLTLVDQPRNEVLKLYRSTRNTFITKLIIFEIVGFVVIVVDLFILLSSIIIIFRIDSIKEEKEKENNILENTCTNENDDEIDGMKNSHKFSNNLSSSKKKENQLKSSQIKLMNEEQNITNKDDNNATNDVTNNKNNINVNSLENPYNEIKLKFIFNNDSSKVYTVNAQKGDLFSDAIKKLKSENSELSEMNMKVFYCDSRVINTKKTILENNLSPDIRIAILCD